MQSKASTVAEYLKSLPADRRKAIDAVRKVILKSLPKGYEEAMLYGMIAYVVPLKFYPEGYGGDKNVPLTYAGLASQKNYMSLYLMNVYGHGPMGKWFQKEFKKAGKKLDMGKSCVRFRKLDDLPLSVIGKTISKTPMQKYIDYYKKSRQK